MRLPSHNRSLNRLSSPSTTTDRLIADLITRQADNLVSEKPVDLELVIDIVRLYALKVNSLLELLGDAE
jgi:hypothetical protein